MTMGATVSPSLPPLRLGETLERLVVDALKLLSPRPAKREDMSRAIEAYLRQVAETRQELDDVASEMRRDIIDFEWDFALPLDLRETLLALAYRLEVGASRVEKGTFAESGPIWAIARSELEPYNDAVRNFVRTAREAASTLRRVVADEVLDDEAAIAAFDAVDPDDPIVEHTLGS